MKAFTWWCERSVRFSVAEKYFTGKPCRNGHIDRRYVSTSLCVTCTRERNTRSGWAARNPERRNESVKKYRDANREKTIAASLRSLAKKPHIAKAWKEANRGKVREAQRAWSKRNPEYAPLFKLRRRRARPWWVDLRELAKITRECRRISKETGVPHHVDHVIPLLGKTVCGLDVPWNLQIIPAVVNFRKANKLLDLHQRAGLSRVTEILRDAFAET